MHEVVLPTSTFTEFVLMNLIWLILAFSLLVMMFLTCRKRRILIERVNKELPEVIKRPLIMGLKIRPAPLLHIFLLVLLIVGIFRFWDQGFSSFQYDNEEIRLKYHNRVKPVILNWSDIRSIRLDKDSMPTRYSIVIDCMNGTLCKSNGNAMASDAHLVETAFIQLNEAKENRKMNN